MDRRAYPDDALKDARLAKRVCTNLAALDVIERGFAVFDMARGSYLRRVAGAPKQSCIFPG
jgi:hypothetical protein